MSASNNSPIKLLANVTPARDDTDAIDQSNVIDERTRGATKSYREPGDEEGLPGPEDGTSSVAGGPN